MSCARVFFPYGKSAMIASASFKVLASLSLIVTFLYDCVFFRALHNIPLSISHPSTGIPIVAASTKNPPAPQNGSRILVTGCAILISALTILGFIADGCGAGRLLIALLVSCNGSPMNIPQCTFFFV